MFSKLEQIFFRVTSIMIILFLIVFFSGCDNSSNDSTNNYSDENDKNMYLNLGDKDKKLLASWEGENVPAFIEKSGDKWYAILQGYSGDGDYRFITGKDPVNLKSEIAGIGKGSIWDISADGDYVVWGERGETGVTINLYDRKIDNVSRFVVLLEDKDNHEYQQAKVYTKNGKVYYCSTDYEKRVFQVICYDIASGESSVLAEEGIPVNVGGYSCFAMRDNILMYESYSRKGDAQLALYDTYTDDLQKVTLPECVGSIWDADIDGNTIALYYYDWTEGNNAWNQTDNIAVFERGEKDIIPVFSFPTSDTGGTWYAFNDDIELFGDNVIWIYQQNISGEVLDHYHMTIYNYKTNQYIHVPATFGFMTDENDLYWLSWNDNVYHVDLYKAIW